MPFNGAFRCKLLALVEPGNHLRPVFSYLTIPCGCHFFENLPLSTQGWLVRPSVGCSFFSPFQGPDSYCCPGLSITFLWRGLLFEHLFLSLNLVTFLEPRPPLSRLDRGFLLLPF